MYCMYFNSCSCLVHIFKLCVCLSMQKTTCQWSLVIQLLEFHNPMNIETNDDNDEIRYCCCDDSSTCASESMFYSNTNNCADKCDIFFHLSLSDVSSEPHSISTIKGTIINSPPHSPYGYTFSFVLHDIPNLVRHIAKCVLQKVCNVNDFEST